MDERHSLDLARSGPERVLGEECRRGHEHTVHSPEAAGAVAAVLERADAEREIEAVSQQVAGRIGREA
jgi:2-methylcitrate dehydratase PrpD